MGIPGRPREPRRRRFFAGVPAGITAATSIAVVIAVTLAGCAPATEPAPRVSERSASAAPSPSKSPSASPSAAPAPSPTFDKARFPTDDPTSLWVVNDKLRPLNPVDFVPTDLVAAAVPAISNGLMRQEAASAIATMFAAAAAEGAGAMAIQNAYRSYSVQTTVHDRLVAQLGAEKADAQSARPGYSEHQTGLSADVVSQPQVCSIQACFADTPQGKWLAANGWRFGFVIRYPAGGTAVTGYIFEPWHVRYVGIDLATEMHDTGVLTLEEFFGLPPAPDYAG